jgi:hypothetical protein
MVYSIRKRSFLTLTLWSLAVVIGISHPLPSFAQKADGKQPPVCEGQLPTGMVKCNYEGGDNYKGSFVNGKPDGQGIMVYANGSKFYGKFYDGNIDNKGVYIYPSGARYEGEFKD